MSVNEDWQAKDEPSSSNSSRIGGVLLLVIATILIVIIIALLKDREKPVPYMAAYYSSSDSPLPIYEENRTSSFVATDIKRVQKLVDINSKEQQNFFTKRWLGGGVLEGLKQDLQEHFKNDDRSPAILYLAFNVAGDLSDDDASGMPTGPVIKLDDDTLIKVGELLQEFQNVQAKTKLVLLDAGQLSHDPNRPTFLEQLHELLRSKQGNFKDDLWVIVSHGTSQTSFVTEAREGSVFNWSVAAALTHLKRHAAEENISVEQLYESICGICSKYTEVRDFDGTLKPLQTPRLMRGGTGIIRDKTKHKDISNAIVFYKSLLNDDTELFPLDEEESGKESETGKDPTKQAENQKTQTDDDPDSGDAKNESKLANLWKLRDQLESRGEAAQEFSPIDVAPHQWMLFNHELVDLDNRFVGQRAGAKDDFDKIKKGLDRMVAIATSGSDPNESRSTNGTLQKIIDASHGGAPIDDQLPAELKIALQNYRDAYFRFAFYLDWCRRQLQSGSNDGFDQVENLFEKLKVASEKVDQTDFQEKDQDYWLEQTRTILAAENEIREVWKDLVEADDMTLFRRKLLLKNFLSSPLVSYNDLKTPELDRARLQEELQKLTNSPEDKFKLDEKRFVSADSQLISSDKILKLWDWQRELAFSGREDDRWEASTNANLLQEEIFKREIGRWRDCVLFGPTWLAGKKDPDKVLRLAMPVLNYKATVRKSKIAFGKDLQLDNLQIDLDNPDKECRFKVPLRKTPQDATDPKNVRLVLKPETPRDFELAKWLSINKLVDQTESPVTLGEDIELEFQTGKLPEFTLCFDVKSGVMPANLNDSPVRLTLVLKAAEQRDLRAPAPIVLKLPTAARTEVSVTGKGLDGEKRTRLKAGQNVSLKPYFNRFRSFEFSLKNDSGRPKVYNLELFAIPTDSSRLPGSLTQQGSIANLEKKRFAATAETPFAVAKDLRRLKQTEDVVTWEATSKDEEVDLTGGMLCRVKQQDDPEQGYNSPETIEEYWIELDELKLESLVEAKAPLFERETGNFRVELEPVPTLPADPFDDGLTIDFTTDNRDIPNPDSVTLTSQNKYPEMVMIPLQLKPESAPTFVYLNVDGYRGIFIFRIEETSGSSQNIRAKNNYVRLRGISETEGDIEKPSGFRAGDAWILPSIKQPTKQDPLKYSFNLLIDVQDNFVPFYRIKFGLKKKSDNSPPISLESGFLLDRKIEYKARLDKGTLQLKEAVTSHNLNWETKIQHKGWYDLIATIVDERNKQIPEDDVNSETQFIFPIHFDSDPPNVQPSAPARKTLDENESFSITVVAGDEAGIDKAELFIDKNDSGKMDQDEEPLRSKPVGSKPGKQVEIQFSIKDLKELELTPDIETLKRKTYKLGVRLTDRFGLPSYAGPFVITVKSQKKEDEDKKKAMDQEIASKPQQLEIEAIYLANETAKGRIKPKKLTLKLDPRGANPSPTYNADTGRIVLDLLPGKYTLLAEGSVKLAALETIKVEGSLSIEIPHAPAEMITFELKRDEEDKSP